MEVDDVESGELQHIVERRITRMGLACDLAEDAVQEAMMRLVWLARQGSSATDLRRMAPTVAKNRALMLVRAEKIRHAAIEDAPRVAGELADHRALRARVAGERVDAILERARNTFSGLRLEVAEAWLRRPATAAEIAGEMPASTAAVAWHLSAIRGALRKWQDLAH